MYKYKSNYKYNTLNECFECNKPIRSTLRSISPAKSWSAFCTPDVDEDDDNVEWSISTAVAFASAILFSISIELP